MKVKAIIDEDFVNYKYPSMFIGAVSCGGKCCIEAGLPLSACHNDEWRSRDPVVMSNRRICMRYMSNPLTKAIVIGGLEPFEQSNEVRKLIWMLRTVFACDDDVVIYTGYTRSEIEEEVKQLQEFDNIIIKFGRFIPNQKPHFDEILGVELVSDNQYAERIS